MSVQKLPVFLSVDTEIWPYTLGWPHTPLQSHEKDLSRQFEHCIIGTTSQGKFGLPYQMACLNRHGLRATCFVEALHAAVVGDKWLTETIGMIRQAGHDVQMHAHPEWLSGSQDPDLPRQHRQYIREYSRLDQELILGWSKRRLERCGSGEITAFRAGSFGASSETLHALADIGLAVDSSYHRGYLGGACTIEAPAEFHQRGRLGGVVELPVTVFVDYPGHFRSAQVTACSAAEFEHLLLQAWRRKWNSFSIFWHGQEFVQPDFITLNGLRPAMRMLIRRFEWLCRFLGDNADKFQTRLVRDVSREGPDLDADAAPLTSNPMRTACRMVEQAVSRYV